MNISFPFWGKIRSTRKIIYSFTVAEDAPAAAWRERPAGRGASWRIVLAYAKVFLQFRVLSVTNVSSVIRIE